MSVTLNLHGRLYFVDFGVEAWFQTAEDDEHNLHFVAVRGFGMLWENLEHTVLTFEIPKRCGEPPAPAATNHEEEPIGVVLLSQSHALSWILIPNRHTDIRMVYVNHPLSTRPTFWSFSIQDFISRRLSLCPVWRSDQNQPIRPAPSCSTLWIYQIALYRI